MGKQYDKVIKKRRRIAYLERVKEKAKTAAAAANKPKVRKPKPKVAEEAPKKTPVAKTPAPAETELANGAEEITSNGPTAITEESVSADTNSDPTELAEETATAPAE